MFERNHTRTGERKNGRRVLHRKSLVLEQSRCPLPFYRPPSRVFYIMMHTGSWRADSGRHEPDA